MSAQDPFFSVLIVNYNAGPHLNACLKSLSKQSFTDFEIIVIDNGSTDDSLELAADELTRVTLLENGENTGFARGCNLAAEKARGTWLTFLNPDAFATPDWLLEISRAIERHPQFDVLASVQILERNPDMLDGAGDPYHALGVAWRGNRFKPSSPLPPEGEVFGPCGAAATYRRSLYKELGGFDESFFCYYEDVDLSFRARLAGARCLLASKAQVKHIGSAIAGEASDFVAYHVARNRIWTFLKCMPFPLIALLSAPFFLSIFLRLLRAPFVGDLSLRWRAARDALAVLPDIMKSRREIQGKRKATVAEISAAMTWSPIAVLDKRADIRPVGD